MFNDAHLHYPLGQARNLLGINWNHEQQVGFLRKLHFADEFIEWIKIEDTSSTPKYKFGNGAFESGDAEFLYQFIRHTQPLRLIEIGSGMSTQIASEALRRNRAEGRSKGTEHIVIDPFASHAIQHTGARVLSSRVETIDPLLFHELDQGDLLFIDSSHVIRPQGDVLFELLEILPVLRRGVYVHIHDIFTPRDYPESWIRNDARMWNEQYVLEAILQSSERYRIVAALNYLKHSEFNILATVCPFLTPNREPGSIYLQVQ